MKVTKKIGEARIRSAKSKGMEHHLVLDLVLPPLPAKVEDHLLRRDSRTRDNR
jgi:hypothetical protein